MKTVNLSVNEVIIVKNMIALAVKTAKSDLRGCDLLTKKLFDETFVVLEAINNHVSEKFNVIPFEAQILGNLIDITIASLKSDARGANVITKRMIQEQISALEIVYKQLYDSEPVKTPVVEPVATTDKKAAKVVKQPRKKKEAIKATEIIETLE